MTTLADLTEEQRAQCVGMWCEIDDIPEPKIIAWVRTTQAGIMFPDYIGEIEACPHEEVTPLPDLPRAWNPDGTPPAGRWETTAKSVSGMYTIKNSTRTRWVGGWEPTE